jgi:hypothetical protein
VRFDLYVKKKIANRRFQRPSSIFAFFAKTRRKIFKGKKKLGLPVTSSSRPSLYPAGSRMRGHVLHVRALIKRRSCKTRRRARPSSARDAVRCSRCFSRNVLRLLVNPSNEFKCQHVCTILKRYKLYGIKMLAAVWRAFHGALFICPRTGTLFYSFFFFFFLSYLILWLMTSAKVYVVRA